MTQAKGVTCCCTTTHNGRILEGYATMSHKGHRVAGKGHRVWCPQCKGIFVIGDGLPGMLGYAPAVEGMYTSCGAQVISSWNDLWFEDIRATTPSDNEHATTSQAAHSATMTTPKASQDSAPHASTPSNPPVAIQPTHVMFRIGVFNDGTGNNFTNSENARRACSAGKVGALGKHPDTVQSLMAACREALGMKGASYEGGETNVHRLLNLYKVTRTVDEAEPGHNGRLYVYQRVYVQGVDTEEGRPDSEFWGGAFGQGNTGVIARAEEAVRAVVQEITTFVRNNPYIIIEGIEFDLFGFSRGAAASRHLAWLIKHGDEHSVVARMMRETGPLHYLDDGETAPPGTSPTAMPTWLPRANASPMERALCGAWLPLKPGWSKNDLHICFIGLFDCVAAYGLPDNADNDPVHLYLPKDYADAVVHLSARDECRLNFASNPVGLFPTIPLPGVHSDVGGGYPMDGWEHQVQGEPTVSVEALLRGEELDRRQSKAWRQSFQQIIDNGWTEENLIDREAQPDPRESPMPIRTWPHDPITRSQQGKAVEFITVAAAVMLKRKVRGEYQLIPLRIMQAMAQDKGVPFSKSPDDVPEFTLPNELVSIKDKLLAYARAGGGKKIPLTMQEEWLLSRRYVHQSANWNPVMGWEPGNPEGPRTEDSDPSRLLPDMLMFPMRPAPGRKRNVSDPKPGH